MKAIVQERYGSADVLKLEDIDKPEIDDDEVLCAFSRQAHISETGTS